MMAPADSSCLAARGGREDVEDAAERVSYLQVERSLGRYREDESRDLGSLHPS